LFSLVPAEISTQRFLFALPLIRFRSLKIVI
jgi:hypothetical protein